MVKTPVSANGNDEENVLPRIKSKNGWTRFIDRFFGKSAGSRVFNVCLYLFFILVAFVTCYPFIYVIRESLLIVDFSSSGGRPTYGLNSYAVVLKSEGLVRTFFYSVGIVLVSTLASVFLTMLSAYPLSRGHLRGRTGFLLFIVFTMLFSGGLIPYYILIKDLGLRNTPWVYLVIGLVGGFNIIIAKNFMQGIPASLEEAAKIDGANDYVILFCIFIPLCLPIVATIALWVGVGKWNDWQTGVLYVSKREEFQLIQNYLRRILISASSTEGVMDPTIMSMSESVKMATVVVGILPIVLIYPFVQKYFVKGVILGSVKE